MAKTAKKNVSTVAAEPVPAASAPPVAIENHVVTKRWTVEKPIDEAADELNTTSDEIMPDDDVPSDIDDDYAGLFFEPEQDNDGRMRAIVARMGGEQNWSLTVQRLRHYAANGRTDPRSRSYAGYLSIPEPGYLENETYLEDIQRQFAIGNETNHFLVCVRRGNKIIGYLPVVSVEPLPGSSPEPVPTSLPVEPVPTVAAVQNPLLGDMSQIDSLVKTMKSVQQLAAIFQPKTPEPAPAPAVNSTEQAIISLLNADGKLIDDITGKIRRNLSGGADAPAEVTFMHLALKAIETDLPNKILSGIRDIMLEARGIPPAPAPPAGSAPAPAPPAGSAPTPAPAPAPPAGSAPSTASPEVVLLNGVIGAYLNNWSASDAADWIDSWVKVHPHLNPIIDQLALLDVDTIRTTLQSAAVGVDLSKMNPYIEALKAEMFTTEPEPVPSDTTGETLA